MKQVKPLSPTQIHQRLLETLEARNPRLARVVMLGAIPQWLDRELLIALRGQEDGQEDRILARLQSLSFINPAPTADGRERLVYNREMRAAIRARWLQQDREGYIAANRRLVRYLEDWLAAHPEPGPHREEMELARLYHALAADPEKGTALLLAHFDQAASERRLAAASQDLAILQEQRDLLPPDLQPLVDYLQARLDQLHEDWQSAQRRLAPLADRTDLPAWLRIRVWRALARNAMACQDWINGLHLLEDALALARVSHLPDQTAWIAKEMGDLYHDFARHAWAEPWAGPLEMPSPLELPGRFLELLTRLPLVLYLMLQIGLGPMLSGALRIGRQMDWSVARLFVAAAIWYRRAETHFQDLDNPQGLAAVREARAWMALNMDHPAWAEEGYRWLLSQGLVSLDPYRRARAQLELANILLRRYGKRPAPLEEAESLLDQALPVFQRFGHARRIAQTHHLRARIRVYQGEWAQAVEAYTQALAAWQEADNPVAATDVAEEMEAVAQRRIADPDLGAALREQAAALAQRIYVTRYIHPFTRRFAQGVLIAFAFLLLLVFLLGFRTETGAVLSADADLVRPIQQGIPVQEEMAPVVSLNVSQQLRMVVDLRVVMPLLAGGLLGYLLAYSAAGLWLIARAPLDHVQRSRHRRLSAHPHQGLGEWDDRTLLKRLTWSQATGLVVADRRFWRQPWPIHSYFALLGDGLYILAPGVTRHYQALQARVRRSVPPQTPVHDYGFRILGSRMGWLFLAALLFFLFCLGLARWAPDALLTPLPLLPYTLVDLFGLAYLGLGIPLAYWFAVQPLRARLALAPDTPLVWALAGAGGLAGLLYLSQQNRWLQSPLGRPDIALGLIALYVLAVAAWSVVGARRGAGPLYAGEAFVYPRPVRFGVLAAATLLAILLVWAMARELVSFHWLAVGNRTLIQVEQLQEELAGQPAFQDAAAAQIAQQMAPEIARPDPFTERYEQAVDAYTRSLAWREDPDVYSRRANVLALLGRLDEAIQDYQAALALDPGNPTLLANLALAYLDQAEDEVDETRRNALYNQAWDAFSQALEALGEPSRGELPLAETIHLLRGGAAFERGAYYKDRQDYKMALDWFARAEVDYTWVIEHGQEPRRRASAYAGRGWVRFWQGRLAAADTAEERRYYQQAEADFQAAIALNPDELSAHTGLGWTYYYFGRTYPACVAGEADPPGAAERGRLFEKASQAYAQVVRLQPQAAIHWRVKAQLDWLVKNCPGYDYVEWLQKAIDDYSEAIRRDPTRPHWYFRQGNMYWDLANQLREQDPKQAEEAYRRAVEDYKRAIELNPDEPQYWRNLMATLKQLGLSPQDALADWATSLAAGKTPTQAATIFYTIGKAAFDARQWEAAIPWLEQAAQLAPQDPRPVWLLAWTYFVLGAPDKALPYAERFAERVTPEFEAWYDRYYLLARLQDRLSHAQEAVDYAHRAVDEVPSMAHLERLAGILRKHGAGQELTKLGIRAQELAPEDPRGYFWQGLGLAMQGKADAARPWYEAGIQVAQAGEAPADALAQAREELLTAVESGWVSSQAAEALLALFPP